MLSPPQSAGIMTAMVAQNEASIWERVVEPSWSELKPEAAEAILQLKFRRADLDRMNELAELARGGSLSSVQRQELETYNRIGHALAIMQSKARAVLGKLPER
jgi:hypothetical protein